MINKSPGPKNISVNVLRNCVGCSDLPLRPIFKKGDKFVALNFRPVSLTSLTLKAMESIIYDHVMQFFLDECLIPNEQYAFLTGKSV